MDRIDRIAEKLASDWFAKARHKMLDNELTPSDLNEAYEVQRALQEKFVTSRGLVAGRKIALSSEAMQTARRYRRETYGV